MDLFGLGNYRGGQYRRNGSRKSKTVQSWVKILWVVPDNQVEWGTRQRQRKRRAMSRNVPVAKACIALVGSERQGSGMLHFGSCAWMNLHWQGDLGLGFWVPLCPEVTRPRLCPVGNWIPFHRIEPRIYHIDLTPEFLDFPSVTPDHPSFPRSRFAGKCDTVLLMARSSGWKSWIIVRKDLQFQGKSKLQL